MSLGTARSAARVLSIPHGNSGRSMWVFATDIQRFT